MKLKNPLWTVLASLALASAVPPVENASASAAPAAKAPPAVPPGEAASDIKLNPFGMCSNGQILSNEQYRVKMLEAGATICRADASFAVCRANNDPDAEHWNWDTFKSIHRLKSECPQLDWLPILDYEPKWTETMSFAEAAQAYGKFVYQAVRRYKADLHYWESWNEPDLPGHAFFRGNGKDFFPYQKECYLAAKKADPKCVVLFAGLCFANVEGYLYTHKLHAPSIAPATSCFLEEYLQECVKDPEAKKNNYYFDVMNQHSYSRASDLYDYTEVDKTLMRDYLGGEKPIWYTETGFTDDGGAWGGSAEEYCDYLLQSFAWAKLAGVERVIHFQLDNSNGHGLYKGMLGEPKLALATYKDVLTKELAAVDSVELLHGNRATGFLQGFSPYQPRPATGYNLFEFRKSAAAGQGRVLMCFSDSADAVDVRIQAKAPSAVLVDRHNNRRTIAAKDGFYSLRLPGATSNAGWPVMADPKAKAMGKPEHLVGGETFVVVEK